MQLVELVELLELGQHPQQQLLAVLGVLVDLLRHNFLNDSLLGLCLIRDHHLELVQLVSSTAAGNIVLLLWLGLLFP